MKEYPQTLSEFDALFESEDACREHLVQVRWPTVLCVRGVWKQRLGAETEV